MWDHDGVREWSDVAREAASQGKEIHMGRLFGICVQKGSELPKGDKRKKYKYRVVFGGNNILDQTWEQAVFQSLGSSPATMSAGKFMDYYSCASGNSGEQADAEQAYIQAELKRARNVGIHSPRGAARRLVRWRLPHPSGAPPESHLWTPQQWQLLGGALQ